MATIRSRRRNGKPVTAQALLEFPVSGTLNLSNICVGPDGNLWASVENDTSNGAEVIRCTPSGVVSRFAVTGATSTDNFAGITAGPDGNLWLCDTASNTIYKISTAGSVLASYPATGVGATGLAGIVSGPDGNLWMADNVSGQIGKMPTTGTAPTWYSTGGGCHGLSVGPDGNLWYTRQSANTVGRCTTAGVVTNIPCAGAVGPFFVAAGPDGNMWFTGRTNGTVGRITLPGLAVSVWTVPAGSSAQPGGCWGGPTAAGTLWLVEETANNVASLPTTGSGAPGGLVQQASANGSAGTVTVTLSNAATAGNLLVCYVMASAATTGHTGPTGFTQLGSQVNGTSCSISVWYKTAAGGETSFSTANGAANADETVVFEITGQTGTPINTTSGTGYNTSTAASATSITTGALTPPTGQSLVIAGVVVNGASTTFSNSWTNGFGSQGTLNSHTEWATLLTTSTSSLSTNEGFSSASRNAASFTMVVNLTVAVPTITETAVPTASAVPDKLVLGNDGNMWCTEHNAAKLLNIRLT